MVRTSDSSQRATREGYTVDYQTIEQAFAKYGVPLTVADAVEAPQLTRYRIVPGELKNGRRARIRQIGIVLRDVAATLGFSGVAINSDADGIWLEFAKADDERGIVSDLPKADLSGLKLVIGYDTANRPIEIDLSSPATPHVLIAGQTGGGKSVLLNLIITSIIEQRQDVDLVLVDLKRGVEFFQYRHVRNLLWPIVSSREEAYALLKQLVAKMNERYDEMRADGINDIKKSSDNKYARMVIVIDELAMLMPMKTKDQRELSHKIEAQLMQLAALGRAAGYHLILATQRPSVDVISGDIKDKFPCRIAFSVASYVDAGVIGVPGANKLSGMGDGLIFARGRTTRFQGGFLSDDYIAAACEWSYNPQTEEWYKNREAKAASIILAAQQGDHKAVNAEAPSARSSTQDETGPDSLLAFIILAAINIVAWLLIAIGWVTVKIGELLWWVLRQIWSWITRGLKSKTARRFKRKLKRAFA